MRTACIGGNEDAPTLAPLDTPVSATHRAHVQGSQNLWQRAVPLFLWGIVSQGITAPNVVASRAEARDPCLAAGSGLASAQPATLSSSAAPQIAVATPQESAPSVARAHGATIAAAHNAERKAGNRAAATLPASPVLRLLRLDGLRHKTDPPTAL